MDFNSFHSIELICAFVCVQEPEVSGCKAMRHVLVGGEALPPALAARFAQRLPHVHLHNAYGPTETTVDATGAGHTSASFDCPVVLLEY